MRLVKHFSSFALIQSSYSLRGGSHGKQNLSNTNLVFKHESIVDLVKKHKKGTNIFPKNIDLVTGGFPCQDFSVSGWRKGFASHKSHLNTTNIKKETMIDIAGHSYLLNLITEPFL